MDTHRTRAHLLVRVAVVLVVVPVAFVVALPMWSEIEVAVVGQALGLAGVDATRVDHQLLLTGDRGTLVLIVIGWCSSCAPVLAVGAAAWVLPGARRRRVGSALAASVLLVVGNVARLAAIGWFGTTVDPAAVDGFHDGPATVTSVVLVLVAAAIVSLAPMGPPAQRTPPGQPARRAVIASAAASPARKAPST